MTIFIGATGQQGATYGQGTGTIFLDTVRCKGSESNILDCSSNSIGTHNCAHSEDAGITCSVGIVITVTIIDGNLAYNVSNHVNYPKGIHFHTTNILP